jgi:hypothetical protein
VLVLIEVQLNVFLYDFGQQNFEKIIKFFY